MKKNRTKKSQKHSNEQILEIWFNDYYFKLLAKGMDHYRVGKRVENAISDTFYRLLKNKNDDFNEIEKPFGFLWRTFTWAYMDLLKKENLTNRREVLHDEKYPVSTTADNEYVSVMKEIFELLLPALPKFQQAAILLYFEGYSYQEIVAKLDSSIDKVSYAIRSAKQFFRNNAGGDHLFS